MVLIERRIIVDASYGGGESMIRSRANMSKNQDELGAVGAGVTPTDASCDQRRRGRHARFLAI